MFSHGGPSRPEESRVTAGLCFHSCEVDVSAHPAANWAARDPLPSCRLLLSKQCPRAGALHELPRPPSDHHPWPARGASLGLPPRAHVRVVGQCHVPPCPQGRQANATSPTEAGGFSRDQHPEGGVCVHHCPALGHSLCPPALPRLTPSTTRALRSGHRPQPRRVHIPESLPTT